MEANALPGPFANVLAIPNASLCRSTSGTTRFTNPSASQRRASIRSDKNISSRARAVPASRVNSHEMP